MIAEIDIGRALPEDDIGYRNTGDKKVDDGKYTPASEGCSYADQRTFVDESRKAWIIR